MTLAEQQHEALRQIGLLAVDCKAVAVAEGNHDAVEHGWLCPGPGRQSVMWPGFSGQVQAGARQIVLTVCPDTSLGRSDADPVIASAFATGAAIRDCTRLPWLVLHHEPPQETPICVPGPGHFLLAQTVLRHQPDLVICAHIHAAPFARDLGGCWHHRIGTTLLVNAGQLRGRRWPCHLLIEGNTVTWRAPDHSRETVPIR